jgi:radical SAM superfamily enzyme YgiQ (UPF0313 family)
MPAAREVARRLRGTGIRTLVVGTHASAVPRRTLEEEPFDFVCQGEGHRTSVALCRELETANPRWERVPGLWYRDSGSEIRSNPPAPKERDLDTELPGQAWELVQPSRYRAHNWHSFGRLESRQPYASILTSLGCPYRCSFCCINAPFGGAGIRYWSPEFVIQQIDLLVQKHGVRNIKISDEMFILSERHVTGICDLLIERGYDLNIWAYGRVDTVKPRYLERLRKAGFRWLALGIESANGKVRDGVEKGRFGTREIQTIVHEIQEAGIHVCANYIFGLPEDTHESMQETLDLALGLRTEWANFNAAMAYPGSKLYDLALGQGLRLPPDWIGYSQHSFESLPLPTETLSGEEVLEFRDRAFQLYFRDSSYLAMIRAKFGAETVEHIGRMLAEPLPRKHLPLEKLRKNLSHVGSAPAHDL